MAILKEVNNILKGHSFIVTIFIILKLGIISNLLGGV